jgi:RimK family alpha-L-glutamate ligase
VPRIGLLASGDSWHLCALADAFGRLGCETVRLDPIRISGRADVSSLLASESRSVRRPHSFDAGAGPRTTDLGGLDALVVRLIPPGSLDQIVFRIDCLHLLAEAGLPVINSPRALERTIDKHWSSHLLQRAGIPTPRTIAAESFDDAMRAFRELGDAVVKPLLGSGGRGIFRVSNEDLAYRSFRALELARAVFYLQEFVPHGLADLRLFVIGDRVVAAARRVSDGWKTNVAAGASAEPYEPRSPERDLALGACRAVGADYAGVDLVNADDGRLLVLEVNGIPGWSALQRTTTTDLALEIARSVQARLVVRHGTSSPS